MAEIEKRSWLKTWLVAARPWALPASTIPVLFGSSLAATLGWVRLDLGLLLLSLAAMAVLHTAANMLSDVIDWKRGLDRGPTPVSGAIVRGWLSPGQLLRGSVCLFGLGSVLGLVLVWLRGMLILKIGLAGIILGAAYPWLKALALGDLVVFVNFGLLGSLGAWVVQTGQFSWLPVMWAVPQGMLVVAILHANNWRDSITDREKMVITLASVLGDRGSLLYYLKLTCGSLLLLVAFALVPRLLGLDFPSLPLTMLLVVLALPECLKLWKKACNRHRPEGLADFITLDGATAWYNLIFGLLSVAGLWLAYLTGLF
ncbi:MAG: prenyltransferase [Candidatus Saccharicenans sp.]|jgi:1,4-dihydroxy-2-naphthoate octaprenyltransferase|nr:prenyltransferase [Candidatus Saccharicenans sp.]MDH7492810.1 prenyltransferase [Candidatus Saccharicenans sp.]